ncbi:MAG: hypothetical protein V4605_03610, partial [Pseudomonadota bacterium]
MSLLIKALDKAQEAKAQAAQLKQTNDIEQNVQIERVVENAKRKPIAMNQQDVAAKSAVNAAA